jgi:TonB family protein
MTAALTRDTFSRNVAISLAGHVILFIIIFVRAAFVPNQAIEMRNAIRVDVVGLPSKVTENFEMPPEPKAPPVPAPAPAPKPEPVKPEVKVEKPQAPTVPGKDAKKPDLKKAQQQALKELQRRQALEAIQNTVKKEKSSGTTPVIAGNEVSPGNSLTGLKGIQFDRYISDVKTKVNSNYNIPTWLSELDLKTQIQILVDEKGFIVKKIVRRSSGNEIFDAKAIEAIEASSPLPPPPPELRHALATGGVTLNFPQ